MIFVCGGPGERLAAGWAGCRSSLEASRSRQRVKGRHRDRHIVQNRIGYLLLKGERECGGRRRGEKEEERGREEGKQGDSCAPIEDSK